MYIQQTMQKLNKSDAMDVISPTKILSEVVAAVNSTPFFKDCSKYEIAKQNQGNSGNWF